MWNLTFITEEDFTNHVKATIEKYGEKLESFDLKRFNKNIIDPIKLIFDKTVYQSSWEEIVSNEIFRQRDKSNNNDIGYFHQRIFQYIATVMYLRMARKAVGMLSMKMLMVLKFLMLAAFILCMWK